jgi:sulfite reductase (NADPH) flavoprotein alpha-component
MALAAGRRPERVLMAAMAQTDCGQCGYSCRGYAEAIASGAEGNIGRCAPGGKATSRKLKELLAQIAVPAGAAATPAIAAAGPSPTQRAPHERFPARLRASQRLNRGGSEKDTRLIVLETDTGRERFQVGDSLGVVARNCPELVAAIIARLRVAPETPVTSPDGIERPLGEALSQACESRHPSDPAIEVLSSRAHDLNESRILQAMAEGYSGAGPDDADLLDLLESLRRGRRRLGAHLGARPASAAALLRIASSRQTLRGRSPSDRRRGAPAKRAAAHRGRPYVPVTGDRAPAPNSVYATAEAFLSGAPGSPGDHRSGWVLDRCSAPFLQRAAGAAHGTRGETGYALVTAPGDSISVRGRAEAWHQGGLLTRLDTAFRSDQEHKIYVQNRLLRTPSSCGRGSRTARIFYVCGDAERMARDVDRGLTYIVAKEGGMEPAAAKAYLAQLAAEGRYRGTSRRGAEPLSLGCCLNPARSEGDDPMSKESSTLISDWNPEDAKFWEFKGTIARRNLAWSILAEHLG